MKDGLRFDVNWTDVAADPTAARIKVDIAGKNAFEAENRWSKTIDDAPHLSALPIATWLANSWWRLRWEGDPKSGTRNSEWRMAHELAAAGGGFIWPRLTFVSDGVVIRVECNSTDDTSLEVLRYISRFETMITTGAFEAGVDEFIQLVIERFESKSVSSELSEIWGEVLSERHDASSVQHRRLEAMLGFDPDEAPSSAINLLVTSREEAGESAIDEIAAFCGSANLDRELATVLSLAHDTSFLRGQVARDVVGQIDQLHHLDKTHELASLVRIAQGIEAHRPVPDRKLAEILGLTEAQLTSQDASHHPIGLAVSEPSRGDRIYFRNWRPLQRRFEAARLFFDEVIEVSDLWHPVTPTFTHRQKAQRSFSAEYLAPIDSLVDYLRGDYSIDAVEGAAEYYDVSWQLVGSQLANHGVISRNHPSVPWRG